MYFTTEKFGNHVPLLPQNNHEFTFENDKNLDEEKKASFPKSTFFPSKVFGKSPTMYDEPSSYQLSFSMA